jgi:hypothetical protein
MVCRITSTNCRRFGGIRGATLVEYIIGIGVAGILMAVLASLMMFSGRSFLALRNYSELNDNNRITVDTMTRDLRECNRVIICTASRLEVEDSGGDTISYDYSQGAGTLTRTRNGVTRTMVTGCDTLSFNLGTRNPVGGTFAVVPTTDVTQAKVVNVFWNCSRTILGQKVNTESVQTARIVIRKQGS